MSPLYRSLTLLTVLGALVSAPAEARFGKHDSGSDDSDSKTHSASSSSSDDDSRPVHRATPGNSADSDSASGSSDGGSGWSHWRARPRCADYACSSFWWGGYGYYPFVMAPTPDERPDGISQAQIVGRPLVFTLGAEVQGFVGGANAILSFLAEGRR